MKNRKPLIGVTPLFNHENSRWWMDPRYTRHIEANGAIPLMIIPATDNSVYEEVLDTVDGVLLTGGQDIDPVYFGEEVLPECGVICPCRDDLDLYIATRAIEKDMPVFGICRGVQVINTVAGGTLYQDIPSQISNEINHRPGLPNDDDTAHEINFVSGTVMAEYLDRATFGVNSFHHQSVKAAAPGFEVAAIAPDGVVEAICHKEKRFVWGVQWHPERFSCDDYLSKTLYSAFINACK